MPRPGVPRLALPRLPIPVACPGSRGASLWWNGPLSRSVPPVTSPGPVPHVHYEFDEAIYMLSGRPLVTGNGEPQKAAPGSMFVAPRGHRHSFNNPSGEGPARISACLHRRHQRRAQVGHPPDPDRMSEICPSARQPSPPVTLRQRLCARFQRTRGSTVYAADADTVLMHPGWVPVC